MVIVKIKTLSSLYSETLRPVYSHRTSTASVFFMFRVDLKKLNQLARREYDASAVLERLDARDLFDTQINKHDAF